MPSALTQVDASGCSLKGPRKDAIDALQKQIDSYAVATGKLRSAQNSHVAISRLPVELLSEVFLCIVESGIDNDGTYFAAGTFIFLQVCKHWNEVAVNFPRLWIWRTPGTVGAWPLFSTRSKDAPLSLTWRSQISIAVKDIFTGPAIRKIHRLDFSGTSGQLTRLLEALDSSALSNSSSIRLRTSPGKYDKQPDYLVRFLPSSFLKLLELDIDFLPDPVSPILTTSNLTLLKLHAPNNDNPHILSQFLQTLQLHPNLQELDLRDGGIPTSESPGPLVLPVLPRLADLRLRGHKRLVVPCLDLISMSSPLHNIVIYVEDADSINDSALTGIMKKILGAYYGCPDHPRTADSLTISSDRYDHDLIFDTESRPTSSRPTSNLKLHFSAAGGNRVAKTFPLFPLKQVREFTAVELCLPVELCRRILQKLERLLHLRLDNLKVRPMLDALRLDDRGVCRGKPSRLHRIADKCIGKLSRPLVPSLQSLTLSHLYIDNGVEWELSNILAKRRERHIGLRSLFFRSCRAYGGLNKARFEKLVRKVTWESLVIQELDLEEDSESDDSNGFYSDGFAPFALALRALHP